MSADGIKKGIDLNLISDEDLRREADKIRQAKALANERDQLSRTPLGPGVGSSPDRLAALPKSMQRGQDRQSAITANRTENAFQESVRKQKESEKEVEKALKEIDKKTKELDTKVNDIVKRGGDFVTDPQNAVQTEIINLLNKAGPAGFVLALVPELINLILKEFEAGGVFDTRIKEQSAVKQIGSLDYLLEIQNGTVLFTESAHLSNEPPSVVNTDRLVAGQMRFYQFHAGEYTGLNN